MNATKVALWIGGGVIALSILTTNVVVLIKVLGGNQPAPVVPVPQQPLATLVPNAEHRATLSAFYRDFAAVLAADNGGIVKTTGQFRAAQNNASKLLSQGEIRYPQFAEAVSQRLSATIGLDDAPMDATKRAALVAALTAISQELGG